MTRRRKHPVPDVLPAQEQEVIRLVCQRAAEYDWHDIGTAEGSAHAGLRFHGVHGADLRALIESRLRIGLAEYGPLDLANDDRDFFAEQLAEFADAVVYPVLHDLRERLRDEKRDTDPAPPTST